MNLFLVITFVLASVCVKQSTQQISTDPASMGFYLYPNAANPTESVKLILGDASSVSSSGYDASKKLIVLIHGFAQNYTSIFPTVITSAYSAQQYQTGSNILVVDWGKMATPANPINLPFPLISPLTKVVGLLNQVLDVVQYPLIAPNVPIAAQRVSDFIAFLVANRFLTNLNNVHIIGMSMGAHVAGIAGKNLQSSGLGTVARVTGLDPAGPLYQNIPASDRLASTDGAYVDVVHTNAGEFGYVESLGMADYYVNGGGPLQSGCPVLTTNAAELFCSHAKAIYYYAASIANPSLQGCKCTLGLICGSCTAFGESSPPTARGDYSLSLPTNP